MTMKRRKAYGLPYKGSKNRIAEWVVDSLPAADTLVDLFAGGCAVSHCAMLSGKFKRVIANDISDAPEVFARAVNGDIDVSGFPLTREQFKASTDTLSRLVYSFGNGQRSYIYSSEREGVCIAAERMMYGATVADRYAAYKVFIRELSSHLQCGGKVGRNVSELQAIESVNRLQAIESVNRLQAIERVNRLLAIERANLLQDIHCACPSAELETSRCDYRDFDVSANATVYADPPYKGTTISQYGGGFDYDAFEDWLAEVDFPVFVSEYTCPKGCVEIAKRDSISLADHSNIKRVVERLFVQERFRDFAVTGDGDGE